MTSPENRKDRKRTVGEAWVWACGAGLVVTLLLLFGLVGLIGWRAAQVFWPARVEQVTLDRDPWTGQAGTCEVAGMVLERRPAAEEAEGLTAGGWWRLYSGRTERVEKPFVVFPAAWVRGASRPEDILQLDRDLAPAGLLFPEALVLANGIEVPAGSPQFGAVLREELRRTRERERLILLLEPGRAAAYPPEAPGTPDSALLRGRLAGGAPVEWSLEGVDRAFFPNRAGWWQRLGIAGERLQRFVTGSPREANTAGGIFPALFGTFVMTVLMSAAVVPLGVLAALYLREYARQGLLVRLVRIAVLNLAGVPSIVFGVFGLAFFVYFLGGGLDQLFFQDRLPAPTFGTGGILWASLTLALLTVPVVIVATEEALDLVPKGLREASMACGATQWQTIWRVVLPSAMPGVLTGLILAMARGAGEVAPLMLVGVVKLAPSLPADGVFPFLHLDRKFMHLGFHIYDLGFQSPDAEASVPLLYATTLVLLLIVAVLNLGAMLLRNHLRRLQAGATF